MDHNQPIYKLFQHLHTHHEYNLLTNKSGFKFMPVYNLTIYVTQPFLGSYTYAPVQIDWVIERPYLSRITDTRFFQFHLNHEPDESGLPNHMIQYRDDPIFVPYNFILSLIAEAEKYGTFLL